MLKKCNLNIFFFKWCILDAYTAMEINIRHTHKFCYNLSLGGLIRRNFHQLWEIIWQK